MGRAETPPVDEGIIRCICDLDHDDGFTIQCEKCLVWQHAACVRIHKDAVPEVYFCEECLPRPVDRKVISFVSVVVLTQPHSTQTTCSDADAL
jgi:hypothetical protein